MTEGRERERGKGRGRLKEEGCTYIERDGGRELFNLCIYDGCSFVFKVIVLHEERKRKVGGLL